MPTEAERLYALTKKLYALNERDLTKVRRDHNDLRSLVMTRKRGPKKWKGAVGGGGNVTKVSATGSALVAAENIAPAAEVMWSELTSTQQAASGLEAFYAVQPDDEYPILIPGFGEVFKYQVKDIGPGENGYAILPDPTSDPIYALNFSGFSIFTGTFLQGKELNPTLYLLDAQACR